jgi:hypothetical protein
VELGSGTPSAAGLEASGESNFRGAAATEPSPMLFGSSWHEAVNVM